MKIFQVLLKKNVFIKELKNGLFQVEQMTILESFFEDLFFYGPEVAIGNLTIQWTTHEN